MSNRIRVGRIVKLNPEYADKYFAYHKKVWDDVLHTIRAMGIMNYSIFYKQGLLFSYYELNCDADIDTLNKNWLKNPVCNEWEKIMMKMLKSIDSNDMSMGNWSIMEEIFHME